MLGMAIAISIVFGSSGLVRAEGGPFVVSTLRPIHLLVRQVMDGVGEPALLGAGVEHAHGGTLSPSERRALSNADLVFWIGPTLEPGLARAIDADVSIALGEGGGEPDNGSRTDRSDLDGARDKDPHIWLAPDEAIEMIEAIAAALSERDPSNASVYAANLEALGAEITTAKDALQNRLSAVADRPYVVEHNAYAHFAEAMGLSDAIALSEDGHSGTSAARLREVAALVAARGVDCVIVEPGTSDRLARALGRSSMKTVEADPLGRGADGYVEMLESVAIAFGTCLGD